MAAIIVVVFSFLAFGTFSNVKEYVGKLKMRIEIMVFRKHINLLDDVDGHEKELLQIAGSITINKVGSGNEPSDSVEA